MLLAAGGCGENALTGSDPAAQGQRPAGAGSSRPAAAVGGGVRVGLETLEAEKGGVLKGKKAGLVAHAASVRWGDAASA